MYLVKRTFRKSSDTLFLEDGAFEAYQRKMYQTKWTHEHKIQEGDTLRLIHVWPNEEIYQRWANDPTVMNFVSRLETYNSTNQIACNEVHARV